MTYIIIILVVGVGIYLYLVGTLRFFSADSRRKHETILAMWLDCLEDCEQKKIYGDDTERIIRMMRHGFEQIVFDVCGYEALIRIDNRCSLSSASQVSIGQKPKQKHEEPQKRIDEKRLKEIFGNDKS